MTTFKELSENHRSDVFLIQLDLCHEPEWLERDDTPVLKDHIRAIDLEKIRKFMPELRPGRLS
jgi:hypothetical protein